MENSRLENMNENFATLKALMLIQVNLYCAWFSFVLCVIPVKFDKGCGHGFAQRFGDGECQVLMDGLTAPSWRANAELK